MAFGWVDVISNAFDDSIPNSSSCSTTNSNTNPTANFVFRRRLVVVVVVAVRRSMTIKIIPYSKTAFCDNYVMNDSDTCLLFFGSRFVGCLDKDVL